MKVIINNINIYHIHDNKFNLNGNRFNTSDDKMDVSNIGDFVPHIVVNDDENHPLIAQLEARILQSENEKKKLLDQLNSKSNTSMEAKQ